MHAKRARLPQKRTRTRKSAGKATAKKQDAQLAPALPLGVADLAAHRAARRSRAQPQAVEIYALVEWIAPARESWRRGELEVRRSACMPMLATGGRDGAVALTDLPGQGTPLEIAARQLGALGSGGTLTLALPGMRVTLTADDLAAVMPAAKPSGEILAFPARR